MDLQKLYSYTRKAIYEYNMIEDGDKIAIGISGGKDSLTLLYALAGLRRFYPKKYELVAITVKLGLENMDFTPVKELCDKLEVPYYTVDTEIYQIIFEARKESNPCSLCAKMRKGAFNEKALELGCNKFAYAHHRDDLFYPQLGVKLCSMAGGGVQKIYMVFLREPSRRDRSGSDLFHLRDGFEIKMNFDRNVSCFIFVNAFMHDDFFD